MRDPITCGVIASRLHLRPGVTEELAADLITQYVNRTISLAREVEAFEEAVDGFEQPLDAPGSRPADGSILAWNTSFLYWLIAANQLLWPVRRPLSVPGRTTERPVQ